MYFVMLVLVGISCGVGRMLPEVLWKRSDEGVKRGEEGKGEMIGRFVSSQGFISNRTSLRYLSL